LSLIVQIVPSGESVQLSARSGSTSAVVTLPFLMAKRVSPRNMNREIAWLCPSVLECGSSVSGSLAAMLRIFFWASAIVGAIRPVAPTTETITRNTHKQSRRGCAMDFSSIGERAWGKRDARPARTREVFEDRDAERDSSMTTSAESVQDGGWAPGGARAARRCRPDLEKLADNIYRPPHPQKRVNPPPPAGSAHFVPVSRAPQKGPDPRRRLRPDRGVCRIRRREGRSRQRRRWTLFRGPP